VTCLLPRGFDMGTTRIYVSSTFADLKIYREAVYRALRQMQKEVIAMEDYVAQDERPLAVCLADVERSDLYVGIFAWRYGFVPDTENPERRSITELEYRHAVDKGIPCLIFLLEEGVPWQLEFADSHTKEGNAGERISALRRELQQDKHTVSFFKNPDHLASLVQSAVSVSLDKVQKARNESAPRRDRLVLHRREITHPLLLAYAEADLGWVERLVDARPQGGILLVPEALLFATDSAELERLEENASRVERSAVLLSQRTLNRLSERSDDSRRVLTLMRMRAGRMDAFCCDPPSVDRARGIFSFDQAHDLSALQGDAIARLVADDPAVVVGRRIGLPYLVVAMTRGEAEQLERHPELIEMAVDRRAREQFEHLQGYLTEYGHASLADHYGDDRESWRPFAVGAGNAQGLDALLHEVVERLGKIHQPQLRGRRLKPQLYPFDALADEDAVLRPIYGKVVESGCLVIVDELSLCHPRISRAAAQLFGNRHLAIVTISPLDHRQLPPYRLLEQELSRSLGFAFDRFDRDLDPQCEVGVGNPRRLKRWLFNSLPTTVTRLFEPEPDRGSLRNFARELDLEDDRSLASDLYSEGGGL